MRKLKLNPWISFKMNAPKDQLELPLNFTFDGSQMDQTPAVAWLVEWEIICPTCGDLDAANCPVCNGEGWLLLPQISAIPAA